MKIEWSYEIRDQAVVFLDILLLFSIDWSLIFSCWAERVKLMTFDWSAEVWIEKLILGQIVVLEIKQSWILN